MHQEYCAKKIESYVQKFWNKNKTFKVSENSNKEKFYCLAMLPYPSGHLHMGHVRNYTVSDVISRYHRLLGKNVLQPMGWDAFGLPAESAAIQNNIHPNSWTNDNIKYMKKQLQSLGFSYDWDREINTSKPEYYRWEQWLFTKLYQKKLAYKKKSFVNWCSYDKTVLANEQVSNGVCWRCNTKVTRKNIKQWFIKITSYAPELLKSLDNLAGWPKKVKSMQKNWIGYSTGIEIPLLTIDQKKIITAYIVKSELLVYATYILISCFHSLSKQLAQNDEKIKTFIRKNKNHNKNEYIGFNTKKSVINPITGWELPIWISTANQIDYYSDAKIAIPNYNSYELQFAKINNIDLQPKHLSMNYLYKSLSNTTDKQKFFTDIKNFELYNNKKKRKIINFYLIKNNIAIQKNHSKLKDWGISRQRYWGVPIPMATVTRNNKYIPIPDNKLPVNLPKITNTNIKNYKNKIHSDWLNITINGENAVRETDTFDTFIESSWYYIRYTSPHYNTGIVDSNAANYWLPVDQYVGGIEHATMHLIYFRFFHKLLRDFKLIQSDEPVKRLLCQGMVLSDAFYYLTTTGSKVWISPSSAKIERDQYGNICLAQTHDGKKLIHAGMIKMSKSKKNGVEPELILKKYGADTLRLFIIFAAPVESELEWKESGLIGMNRFLKKLWSLVYKHIKSKRTLAKLNITFLTDEEKKLYVDLQNTIDKVSNDIDQRQSFNTAISAIISFVNQLILYSKKESYNKYLMQKSLINIIRILYPFAPHFCFIIWQELTLKNNIDQITWPSKKIKLISSKPINFIIQINGKKRHKIIINENICKSKILEIIKKEPILDKYLKNKKIINIFYVPKKIINLILE